MKKGVTIKDIARELNMSISTVSKALSNDSSISVLTKDRVNQLAKEWNYIPNEADTLWFAGAGIAIVFPGLLNLVAALRH